MQQRLARIGVMAVGLALLAATAQADPFMLNSSQLAKGGGGATWFQALVKVDDALPGGGAQLFLTDVRFAFGGHGIFVPSGVITYTAGGSNSSNFSSGNHEGAFLTGFTGNLFLAGAVNGSSFGGSNSSSSSRSGSSADAGRNTGGFTSQVPGAGAAYNPFDPALNTPGAPSGSAIASLPSALRAALANSILSSGGTVSAASVSVAAVPTTPEPSPLLLLATGLAVFMIWKKRDALKSASL